MHRVVVVFSLSFFVHFSATPFIFILNFAVLFRQKLLLLNWSLTPSELFQSGAQFSRLPRLLKTISSASPGDE